MLAAFEVAMVMASGVVCTRCEGRAGRAGRTLDSVLFVCLEALERHTATRGKVSPLPMHLLPMTSLNSSMHDAFSRTHSLTR